MTRWNWLSRTLVASAGEGTPSPGRGAGNQKYSYFSGCGSFLEWRNEAHSFLGDSGRLSLNNIPIPLIH